MAQIHAMVLNVVDDDEDNIDVDGEAAALDHVGVAVPAVERCQMKRPSKYQIGIGDDKTMQPYKDATGIVNI